MQNHTPRACNFLGGGLVGREGGLPKKGFKSLRHHDYWLQTPKWKKAERLVVIRLREKGVKCKRINQNHSPFDITSAGGLRIEVKSAQYRIRDKSWTVGVARWGKFSEHLVDFYIWVLKGHPSMGLNRRPIYLIVPSPIRRRNVRLTLRTLFGQYHSAISNWSLIVDAEKTAAEKRAEKRQLEGTCQAAA